MTNLSAKLPKGNGNGLADIAGDLVTTPGKLHVVVALIDCSKVTEDIDAGDKIPTARIRRIEVIDGQDKELAQRMLRRAMEERTGQTVLPMDLEDDLRAAFGNIDPHTGEILGAGDDQAEG